MMGSFHSHSAIQMLLRSVDDNIGTAQQCLEERMRLECTDACILALQDLCELSRLLRTFDSLNASSEFLHAPPE